MPYSSLEQAICTHVSRSLASRSASKMLSWLRMLVVSDSAGAFQELGTKLCAAR